MKEMNEQIRGHLVQTLPDALYMALEVYKDFAGTQHEDAADFKKHQEACKAAVAHIELLIKLAANVSDMLPKDSQEHEDLSQLIQNAMDEVARYKSEV